MTTRQTSTDSRELLAWGYVRNIEKLHKDLNIPLEINNIIYLYQRLCDEWSQEYKSKYTSVDADKSIVTVNTNDSVTMYGQKVIKEGLFIWKVKIISITAQ